MAIRRFFAAKNLNESLEKRHSSDREFGMQEAFAELNRLYEADETDTHNADKEAFKSKDDSLAQSTNDPYGYGPYKNFSDPDIAIGDYVLTTRPFSRSGATYPARITSVSPKWIEYEISGFGFTDKGTKARPGSDSDRVLRKAATYLNSEHLESLQEEAVLESSLTAEEKVDAWHDGTRRENYKAAGIPKLQGFLEIAKRKGYDDIVAIIEGELANRGITTPSATTTTATSSTPDLTASVSTAVEEPVSLDVDLEAPAPAATLSDKDLDALLGMAIQKLGTCVLSARSVWKSAGGYTGSYSLIWQNSNGNPVKPDRAVDKVRDLTYDTNKLILLTNYFPGGLHNIDRYYSIDVPASTTYTVDRDTIYEQARQSHYYYDSELNWRFYVLAKTKANQKKVAMFLLEKVPTLTPEQAAEITTKFFER